MFFFVNLVRLSLDNERILLYFSLKLALREDKQAAAPNVGKRSI